MHNMLIIATNHLSMLTVYVRHRDPNCPAPSPRLLCCHISRGRNGDTSSQYFHYFPTICKSITGTPHLLGSHIQSSAILVFTEPLPLCTKSQFWWYGFSVFNSGQKKFLHRIKVLRPEFPCRICFSPPCRIACVFNARLHLQNWDSTALSRKWFSCVKLYFEGDLVGIFVRMLMSLLISRDSAANGITPH